MSGSTAEPSSESPEMTDFGPKIDHWPSLMHVDAGICHATPSPACQVCQDQAYLDTLAEGKRVPFSSVQSLYHVELKSSLRLRLAH